MIENSTVKTIFGTGKLYSLLLICFVLFLPNMVLADFLIVRSRGSYEVKQIELLSGQSANIEVHLMSAGELVGGYQVSLYRDSDGKEMGTLLSDDNGVLTFTLVSPDKYTLVLRRSEDMKRHSTIGLGDFLLKAYYPETNKEIGNGETQKTKQLPNHK